MKKVSELGMEVIELEDQVLLVDQNKPRVYGDYYVLKNAWGLDKHEITEWTEVSHSILSSKKSKPTGVIVASTKPLEGLPLLVIEDEAMLNALNLIEESKIETESTKLILIGSYTTGYDKAKETYKFTEEDLREAICEAWNSCADNEDGETFTQVFSRIIQSLTKKELWVETEEKIALDGHTIIGTELKITNNQIKGIWK